MKIGIFGTGMVGRTLAEKLQTLGHEVKIGTRNVKETEERNDPDHFGNPAFSVWQKSHQKLELTTFTEVASFGEIIINATAGIRSLEVLKAAGAASLKGKILIDIANPLDSLQGMPPRVAIEDGDSLGERIQKAFPETKIVKALNTVNALLMANPETLAGGEHTTFISGNDSQAKKQVTELLKSFGWKDIVDLGDITTARGTEHYLPLWLRMFGAFKTPMFSIKVVR